MRRNLAASACLGLCLLAVGCAAPQPIGPGSVFEPDKREARLWEAARQASAALRASGALYPDENLPRYVQSVLTRVLGNHLAAYAPLEPRVYVLDSPVQNAFACPHGHIFVHTGLLGRIRNEAQLAMILGHEITHATHRHTYQEHEHT